MNLILTLLGCVTVLPKYICSFRLRLWLRLDFVAIIHFLQKDEVDPFKHLGSGNRIATWLFYESDVELGGATVFPSAGLTLWPKKGSAAFWYNLLKNGEGDEMTLHAACPVLAGTKWGMIRITDSSSYIFDF